MRRQVKGNLNYGEDISLVFNLRGTCQKGPRIKAEKPERGPEATCEERSHKLV